MVRAAEGSVAFETRDSLLRGRAMSILVDSIISIRVSTCISSGADRGRLRLPGDGGAFDGIGLPGSGDR
jgi:hypothetical protein